MIQINGTITLSPGDIDKARDALSTMMEKSQAEDGCLDYCFAQHVGEPDTLILFERWRDQAALQAHMASAHMAEFQQSMAANPPLARELRIYETDEGQPLG